MNWNCREKSYLWKFGRIECKLVLQCGAPVTPENYPSNMAEADT